MFLGQGRTDHRSVGGPRRLPFGTDTMCVKYSVRRVGLQLNISNNNPPWKTLGSGVILVRIICIPYQSGKAEEFVE
jgi:hypothetical protein